MTTSPLTPARRLASAIEAIAGQAQFSPECQANYEALGFDASPGKIGSTTIPDRSAYFTARGSVLGDVPGTVVAAAFGVFNPETVIPLVAQGRRRTDAATMWQAREQGAIAQLDRVLGAQDGMIDAADQLLAAAEPLPLAGRALFAGQRNLPVPDDTLGRLWRATDLLREYRGDSHILAWASEGLDGLEVGILGDLYWGLAPHAHTGGRGWTDDQLAAGDERLHRRGLLTPVGDALTPAGFALRERIEARTDELIAPAIEVLGSRLDDLVSRLQPWSQALIDAGAYLSPLVRFTY